MRLKRIAIGVAAAVLIVTAGLAYLSHYNYDRAKATVACLYLGTQGFRPIAETREERFLGKVRDFVAQCRGGDRALAHADSPWVDWSNYWGTGDDGSRYPTRIEALAKHLG